MHFAKQVTKENCSMCHRFVFVYEKNVSFWRESKSTRPHLNVLKQSFTIVLCNIPEKPSFIIIEVQELYRQLLTVKKCLTTWKNDREVKPDLGKYRSGSVMSIKRVKANASLQPKDTLGYYLIARYFG